MSAYTFETEQHVGKLDDSIKQYLVRKQPIYRLTSKKGRIYFTKADKNKSATIYNSGTTIIDNYRDKEAERALHLWKVGLVNSGQNPDEILKTRQDYGTILHITYGRLLNGEKTTFELLEEFIKESASQGGFEKTYGDNLVENHIGEYQKDLASFLTWIKDYNVKPLGVELMVASDKYEVATALDLIAEIDHEEEGYFGEVYKTDCKGGKKGDPKLSKQIVRRVVLIDFKSGKKGFYSKNVLQLLLSRKIFEENFPEIPIASIYNFAPNDWTGTNPTYKFYDQERETKQIDFLKSILENVLERGKIEFRERIKTHTEKVISGVIDTTDIQDDYVSEMNLIQIADKYWNEKYVETEQE